jgi:hypothetical protein
MTVKLFFLLLIASASLAAEAAAQVRTWGFSRDSVTEWAGVGYSVTVVNQANDTLRFDTVAIEPIGSATDGRFVRFYRDNSSTYYAVSTAGWWGTSPTVIAVAPNQSMIFREFQVDINGSVLAKKAVGSAIGDTIRARLIFQAASGRGKDTLLVSGIQQLSVSLKPGLFRPRSKAGVSFYDLRGRVTPVSLDAARPRAVVPSIKPSGNSDEPGAP